MTAAPGPVLHPLEWDSTAFGFAVARIDGVMDPWTQLSGVPTLLAQSRTRLAYWEWPSNDPNGRAAATVSGGDFVNTRAVLSIASPRGAPPDARAIVASPTSAEREALDALALASGWSSRFALDPRFPNALFETLYRTWMANSLSGAVADAVIAARDGAAVQGMITVSACDGHGRIGLFGVAAEARGRGIGKALLHDALGWFAERRCTIANVVTQGENQNALAVYRAVGFSIDDLKDVFHFWNQPS